MKRGFATLLTCALVAYGQRSAPPAAAAPASWVIDAVALDASGHPVADLTAEDFEIVQGGRARKITNFTWFDTRLHMAASRPGQAAQLPALDLLPDEIRRNLVVVVDDLGLSLAGIDAVRSGLQAFTYAMASGDRMAILRSSGGSGLLQQLTGDTRILVNAIDGIRYLGGSTGAASAGSACWLTLDNALEGLRDIAGRKVVVVFTENPGGTGPRDGAVAEAAHAAHAGTATVYAIHPLSAVPGTATGAPSPLETLARDTGGLFGGDFERVLQNEQGYYAIGFQPEDSTNDPTARWSPATSALIKVRRPGVVVRSRAGFLRQPHRVEFPARVEHEVQVSNALASPFAGPDIRVRLTAHFSEDRARMPVVGAILHFDPRELTFIHDLEDVHHASVLLMVAAYTDDRPSPLVQETAHILTLRPAEYRQAIENGVRIAFTMRLAGPGAWRIRAMVADDGSDRIGSATRFVEIPDLKRGGLALSGLTMRGGSPADSAPADPLEDAGVRIFKPGRNCTFLYSVFNALAGPDKQSRLEVQTRIFAEGRVVFDGKPASVSFGETPEGTRRQIAGQIRLDLRISPGDYILLVTVRDMLAPPGQARTATQFTDFQVGQ